jgi:glycosyltransferase involved in cell wall biosynthesis
MKPTTPRVVVCTPTYNRATYLKRAIDSVLAQSFRDFVLLVVDDGSTDDTPEVLASVTDPRLRYVRNPTNLGMVGCWNRCLELAPDSEFMARLDDDDVYLPDLLATLVATLEADPEAAFAYSAVEFMDDDGAALEIRHPLIGSRRLTPRAAFGRMVESNRVPTPTVVMRRSALASVGPYDPAAGWCADWDMWLRLASRYAVVYVDQVLARYRITASSETTRSEADGSAIACLKYSLDKALASVPPGWLPRRQVLRGRRTIARYELMLAFKALYRGDEVHFRRWALQAVRYAPQLVLEADTWAALGLALASLTGGWGPRLVWNIRDAIQRRRRLLVSADSDS